LVEDDDAVRAVLQKLLQARGYTVLGASNADKALLICEQYGADVHLLLVDVVLPWPSGPQLVERLAPLKPAMKVLCMSGHDERVVRGKGPLSTVPCLGKPIPGDVLARTVREVLDGRLAV
jgi:DNA-binding NtrC family response regulator